MEAGRRPAQALWPELSIFVSTRRGARGPTTFLHSPAAKRDVPKGIPENFKEITFAEAAMSAL